MTSLRTGGSLKAGGLGDGLPGLSVGIGFVLHSRPSSPRRCPPKSALFPEAGHRGDVAHLPPSLRPRPRDWVCFVSSARRGPAQTGPNWLCFASFASRDVALPKPGRIGFVLPDWPQVSDKFLATPSPRCPILPKFGFVLHILPLVPRPCGPAPARYGRELALFRTIVPLRGLGVPARHPPGGELALFCTNGLRPSLKFEVRSLKYGDSPGRRPACRT
jgi:hypothetical protein